jgi:hypothetical protein
VCWPGWRLRRGATISPEAVTRKRSAPTRRELPYLHGTASDPCFPNPDAPCRRKGSSAPHNFRRHSLCRPPPALLPYRHRRTHELRCPCSFPQPASILDPPQPSARTVRAHERREGADDRGDAGRQRGRGRGTIQSLPSKAVHNLSVAVSVI